MGRFPGLKPWAESCCPPGTGPRLNSIVRAGTRAHAGPYLSRWDKNPGLSPVVPLGQGPRLNPIIPVGTEPWASPTVALAVLSPSNLLPQIASAASMERQF
jgi:hypothetical protein